MVLTAILGEYIEVYERSRCLLASIASLNSVCFTFQLGKRLVTKMTEVSRSFGLA